MRAARITEESTGGLSRSFSAATVPWLLWRPEAASLTSTVALTLALALTLTRAREPAALGPVAIPAVPGIAADIAAVATEAAATGSRPVPAATTATAELVAGVVAPTARLTDGEVGWAPFVFLTLDARQLRADQRTVDRALFRIGEAGLGVRGLRIGARLAASGKHRRLEGRWRFRRGLAACRRRGPAHHRRGGQIVSLTRCCWRRRARRSRQSRHSLQALQALRRAGRPRRELPPRRGLLVCQCRACLPALP